MTYHVSPEFLDAFEAKFGPVARGMGRLIRPSMVAPKGKTFVWVDWSAIEARVLPWLSDSRGGQKVLDIFEANDADPEAPDIYMIEAGNALGMAPEGVGKTERQTGKVIVLSLGFGGSVGALQNMAKNYRVYIPEAEALRLVQAWRDNNKWARSFWGAHKNGESYGLWGAACRAYENLDTIQKVGKVAYLFDRTYLGGSLACALPDGRLLWYPKLGWREMEYTDKKTGDVEKRTSLAFKKGYGWSALWYGKLAENITQATAASLLRKKKVALRQYEDWMPLIAHTHDEIVALVDEDRAEECEAVMLAEMTRNDPWNEGLPLAAEATENYYYTKAM